MSKTSELAKQSWKNALKHYVMIKNEYGDDYGIICDIIKDIQSQGLDERLHALTSHEMLNISTEHRYDAKTDVVRISTIGDAVTLEYFHSNKPGKPDVLKCNKESYIKNLQSYIRKLIEGH